VASPLQLGRNVPADLSVGAIVDEHTLERARRYGERSTAFQSVDVGCTYAANFEGYFADEVVGAADGDKAIVAVCGATTYFDPARG
jgi:hypothetical protein